uniref:Myosin IXA n=1 Tax=Ornithorhynchus anatinus TaxID=9258 RepID=A0A6I8NZB5_ORNAN
MLEEDDAIEDGEHTLHILPRRLAEGTIYCPRLRPAELDGGRGDRTPSIAKLRLDKAKCYVLAEVKEFGGEEMDPQPHGLPRAADDAVAPDWRWRTGRAGEDYRFLLGASPVGGTRQEKYITYVGSILIVINPFKFLPIYNPKYVKMYDNHQLGKAGAPPFMPWQTWPITLWLSASRTSASVIFRRKRSGKTQSTKLFNSLEQIILGAGPVLEAFGNAKTAHNNNSSRFGKFIQVNYQETGTVRGAYVEKYLLEKSRLVYQEHNERNYHVFYYLLAGASEEERLAFHLKKPEEYHYLNQMTKKPLRQSWDDCYYDSEPDCFTVEGEDLKHDFERLQLAMEMVGFLPKTRRQIFSLLSAILHLGNICYKKKTYRDDSIDICNPEVLPIVSELLEVKEEMLFEALVTRKTVTVGEKFILPYKLAEAVTVRNSMAKSLYSALFDWIVFRINHALLNTKDLEENTKTLSIGVLDIFGFEDYESNSFEQFCINFANESLQHYFNQHIFKLEQEEYLAEGISWHNIDYIDNSSCINLISKKPTGLLHLLDEESNFPQATNQTLLDKFKRQHEGNSYIEFPAVMEPAFIIKHYAGKVKYGVKDFREKNTDHMRPDIVALLRSSKNAFICEMIGNDPVAVFRWSILRAFFRAMVAFREAGKRYVEKKTGHDDAVPCAVLKSVDSFSFLHHPVHQRSLEILQRCKEEKYSITRKSPRTPLSDLQGVNTIIERTQRDTYGIGWNGRPGIRQSRLAVTSSLLDKDGIFVNSTNSKLLERAHGILMRNKNFKAKHILPKHLLEVKSLKHLTNLTLQDRITKSLLHLHKKKKPPSISAQFQVSLNKLMETLGQAEPYFVKCIRSNAEKLPLRFSDSLVLRQLRYTGMLETVRIRQSGYGCKYSFQEFVGHFHVLLQRGTIPSKSNIQAFFRKIETDPDNYQVGRTMVFLKEQERQHLQGMLHQEVLCRIILLQRWFRAVIQRQHFLNLKRAAIVIQRYWRNYQSRKQADIEGFQTDTVALNNAAIILQSSWRAYLERRRYLQIQAAASIIQNSWRRYSRRRHAAATRIQARWRGFWESRLYREQRNKIILLQAAFKGYEVRKRFKTSSGLRLKDVNLENGLKIKENELETDEVLEIKGSDPSEWEDGSFEERVKAVAEHKSVIESSRVSHPDSLDSSEDLLYKGQERASSQSGMDVDQDVVVRERPKSLEDLNQKKVGRAKRESRRMRELEQAIFSLELLKVRSSSGTSPSEERRWSTELASEGLHSPQGTPESESSQGSLELLSCEENLKSKPDPLISDERGVQSPSAKTQNSLSSSPNFNLQDDAIGATDFNRNAFRRRRTSSGSEFPESSLKEKTVSDSPAITYRPHLRDTFFSNSLPTFYIPPQDHLKTNQGLMENNLRNKQMRNVERPGTVLAMHSGSGTEKFHKAEEGHFAVSLNTNSLSTDVRKLEQLNIEKEERQKQIQQQNEKEMMEQIRQQKDILEKEHPPQLPFEKQHGKGETSRTVSLKPQKKGADRPQSLLILNTQSRGDYNVPVPKSVDIKGLTVAKKGSPPSHLAQKDRPSSMFFERQESQHQPSAAQELAKTDHWSTKLNVDSKDFSSSHLSKPEQLRQMQFHSHSFDGSLNKGKTLQRFASADGPTKLHKTMSQGEIGKLSSVHKTPATDGRPQKTKMRFWAKGRHGEKKASREKLATQSELLELHADQEPEDIDKAPGFQFNEEIGQHHLTPPKSPELPGNCRKEFKENKEPSPKVKRKRSVKISNVALESMQWQSDSVQIITSASDLKSMDEFLLKKMNDLDNEDSKKDTLVDVVFKKALKEFRQNIFSFYSSALAMDDGKSIRYKDLYALFEQILEKTMRLEQRDWSESPVKVWVNTFKVFLDEYMTEFKPMECTSTKIPKAERKKRRKKDTDVVEEYNGHIFKATQYSIPTYCEYCSSLIWIMDKASVCKLCKYACHKKCCLKTATKCSKKYEPELSSRQFGVELSRLTNEERTVPVVVEKLTNYIEMHGLYTEGIYRKSGSTNKIKELRHGLDTDIDNVNLDDYNIHVIASVFKQWLRDLPNPLMTFELYEEFLRAMGLQERKEIIQGVYSVIDQLSRTHLNTLERLVFHLVRIALQEETNRMSANALAIVFAPCILRCPDTIDPLKSVQDISKTTTCVELVVTEQMNKYRARLKDIDSLEFAENKAKSRLSLIRRSMGKGRLRRASNPSPSSPGAVRLPSVTDVPEESVSSEEAMDVEVTEQQQAAMQREERVLTEQIESLQKEKEELTFEMLALEPRASDDETLESEASIGTADSSENLNFDSEGAVSDRSERSLTRDKFTRAEPSNKLRRQLKKQQDSLDSLDSSVSSPSPSHTASSHVTRKRFQIYSKSPFYRAASVGDPPELRLGTEGSSGQSRALEERPQFISRGTFNPEKGKQKLKNVKNSPQKTKEPPEGAAGAGHKGNAGADCSSTQQLVLFGSNEFMV